MKRILCFAALLWAFLPAFAKDWKGKVIDRKGEAVPYATVAVLEKADSSVVCGTVTEDDGTYLLKQGSPENLLMVAIIGYKTQYLPLADNLTITLEDDSAMLEEASVQAFMPKTKVTGEGLQTSVKGSVLETAGSARDVLGKTPGMIKGQNGLEVIGKGSPVIYINGRKLNDAAELDRLPSNEIQSVEVITNPGAQYDAEVTAVVRIRTVRRQGDGFSLSANAADEQSLRWGPGNDAEAAVKGNYRVGGVDIFAGIHYNRGTERQYSPETNATSYGIDELGKPFVFENKGTIDGPWVGQALYGDLGVNWQIAANHSLGGKLEWKRDLEKSGASTIQSEVRENGTLVDKLTTLTEDSLGPVPSSHLGANLYYNGTVAEKLGIDVNLDYFGTQSSQLSVAKETSSMTTDATVQSQAESYGRMWAAKAVLSYPIWMGQLQIGTEDVFSRLKDNSSIVGVIVPTPVSNSTVKQDNLAAFVSYGCYIPQVGQISAGVRYEHVNYSYEDAITPSESLGRSYGKWFPTFSYANAFGPVQLMLNYSAKTRRPSYSMLSGAIRYNNRYLWQSGNTHLMPQISNNLGLTAVWKWISLVVNYTRTDQRFMLWSEPYGDDGVVMVKPKNIDTPYRNLSAFVNFTPTIGPWTLNYTVGVMPQWLTIYAPDKREASGIRETRFNGQPICFAQLQNTWTVKGDWQFELGAMLQTPGYTDNMRLSNPYFDLSAAVQKKLLKDGSLVLRLEGNDLAGTAHYDIDTDFGSYAIRQVNWFDTQRVKLSVRYNFNTAQSKYRGTGAGADEKGRM